MKVFLGQYYSALSQKYSNFRIIFINDNSSDKTLSFLRSFKK